MPACLRVRTELSTKGPSTLPSTKRMAVLIRAIWPTSLASSVTRMSWCCLNLRKLSYGKTPYQEPNTKNKTAHDRRLTENKAFNINYYSLPFILVQGFIVALFGQRGPREARDVIYINLFMERPISNRPPITRVQEGFFRVLAALNYLFACAVVIFCAPLFIINISAQELQIWTQQPESESPYQVGQWSVWAYTVLVILEALIARCHYKLVHGIALGCRAVGHRILSCFSRRGKPSNPRKEHATAEFTD